MAAHGPNLARRSLLSGPWSTLMYIETHKTKVFIWPSDSYLLTVFGPSWPEEIIEHPVFEHFVDYEMIQMIKSTVQWQLTNIYCIVHNKCPGGVKFSKRVGGGWVFIRGEISRTRITTKCEF